MKINEFKKILKEAFKEAIVELENERDVLNEMKTFNFSTNNINPKHEIKSQLANQLGLKQPQPLPKSNNPFNDILAQTQNEMSAHDMQNFRL